MPTLRMSTIQKVKAFFIFTLFSYHNIIKFCSSESFQSHLSFPTLDNTLIQTLTDTHLISAVSPGIETKLRGVVNVPLTSPQQRALNPLIIAVEQVKRSCCLELVEHHLGKRQGRIPTPQSPSSPQLLNSTHSTPCNRLSWLESICQCGCLGGWGWGWGAADGIRGKDTFNSQNS